MFKLTLRYDDSLSTTVGFGINLSTQRWFATIEPAVQNRRGARMRLA